MLRGSHHPIHRRCPAPIAKRPLSLKKMTNAASPAHLRGEEAVPFKITGAYFRVSTRRLAREAVDAAAAEPGFAKVAATLGMQAMCLPRRRGDFFPGPPSSKNPFPRSLSPLFFCGVPSNSRRLSPEAGSDDSPLSGRLPRKFSGGERALARSPVRPPDANAESSRLFARCFLRGRQLPAPPWRTFAPSSFSSPQSARATCRRLSGTLILQQRSAPGCSAGCLGEDVLASRGPL